MVRFSFRREGVVRPRSEVITAALTAVPSSALAAPTAHAADRDCADFANQAEAQGYFIDQGGPGSDPDRLDGSDRDGVACESLPCPCAAPGGGDGGPAPPPPPPKASCTRPSGVKRIVFRRASYPNIRRHYLQALDRGWPKVMVINRPGADARRDRLLEGVPTRDGFDRDEYPAAVGRGRANGRSRALVRGRNPRGWKADVAYVPSSENRSHGSSLGNKLNPFCNGTRFRYVFR